MWPDPTDLSRRKPRFMKGTPANKASVIFCCSSIGVVIGGYILLSYTPFFQKKIQKNIEFSQIQEENRELRAFVNDPLVRRIVEGKEQEYEEAPDWLTMN